MGHRCGVSGTRRSMRQRLLPVGRKSIGVGRHDFWKMWSQAAPAWGRKRHARRHESRRTTPTASARTTCPPRGKPQVGSRRAESGTGDAPNQRWRRACTGSPQRRCQWVVPLCSAGGALGTPPGSPFPTQRNPSRSSKERGAQGRANGSSPRHVSGSGSVVVTPGSRRMHPPR